MTGQATAPIRRFPATTLPWVIAACAVAVYSLTLNPWISFSSVNQVAQVSGWVWEPIAAAPLYYLVTLPFRALPTTWIPAALNLFNALCAAATLALLVRTVAILPHNRTHAQRLRAGSQGDPLSFRTAWLPPVVAAIVCGLQLTFWENATSGTKEMLNLLLFAYVVRCLVEFRLDKRAHWLSQSAVVMGLGITNSYAFIGFFPLYILSLLWLKRASFFNGRFLLRMTLLGLAGLSLYLLLPIVESRTSSVDVGFLAFLKFILSSQKWVLSVFPRKLVLLLSLTSIVPILLISIRWPQSFGDISPHGARVTSILVHVMHAAFLVACIWIAFDPPVSARHMGLGQPFLTFYYLGAIAVGYFAGYLLVVFGRESEERTYTFGRKRRSPFHDAIVVGVWLLAGVTFGGLVFRNLPQIHTTNSSMLRDYASLIADQIPEGNSVVLCDDSAREYVLLSTLAQRGDRPDAILLNTHSLAWPQYHQIMAEKFPGRWPSPPPTNRQVRMVDEGLVSLMKLFSRSNQVCYAHPSFGYYFEAFYPKPAGILNLMVPYARGELLPPPLTEATVGMNEEFWDTTASRLLEAVEKGARLGETDKSLEAQGSLLNRLHLEEEKNQTAVVLGEWLSRSLNSYGVELQRAGFLSEAAKRFEQALRLNPDNIAANINLKFNADLQSGRESTLNLNRAIQEQFETYQGTPRQILRQVLEDFGLFDEPRFSMNLAGVFVAHGLYRQALIEFDRVSKLLPDRLGPRLWYARLAAARGGPDEALEIVRQVRRQPERFDLNSTNKTELVFVEAAAYLAKAETNQALQVIEQALEESPDDPHLVNTAFEILKRAHLFTEALRLIDRQLAAHPDDVSLLVNKGFVLLQLANLQGAVEVLDRALALQPDNASARLNRAIANLKLENFEQAKSDYEALLLQFPNSYPIYFGLGEIAFQQKDTNLAVYNYRLYLSNAPPNSAEARLVRQRLESLGSPTQ